MKKILPIVLCIVLGLNFACSPKESSLDQVRAYHADDKYFKSALVSLHFLLEVSPISKVDTVFSKMIEAYKLPIDASGAKDGTYQGESPPDAFDYLHTIEIKIKNEKIVSVDYNEKKIGGIGKQEDTIYCEEMKIFGTTPAIAYPSMEGQLLESQNMLEVDAVAGATYSLYRFRYALTVALMKAKLHQ